MTTTIALLIASLLGELGSGQAEPQPTPVAVAEAVAPAEPEALSVAAEPEPAAEAQPVQSQEAVAETEAQPEPESTGAGEKKAKKAKSGKAAADGPRNVRITSERTDYDRKEGVIMFDGSVHVDDDEYQMCSNQLYVFLDGTNELKRIVAIGDVAITNDTRRGFCSKAAYTKSAGKVVMYGDGKDAMAKLVDEGKRRSEVVGRKITFWIDSEQVEVEGSTVTLDAGGFGGKDGAKKLLGK